MTERDKVTVEDITGIVHTDEPTDSVEEVRKLRGRTNERFIEHIKNTIKEAYHNERTQLGKSVLKQLMETIQ